MVINANGLCELAQISNARIVTTIEQKAASTQLIQEKYTTKEVIKMERFFQALFEYNEDNYILIWTYKKDNTKESHWFKDWREAASFSAPLKDIDTYVGVGLSPKDYGPNKRCLQKT